MSSAGIPVRSWQIQVFMQKKNEKTIPPLRESVEMCLTNYFNYLEGHNPSDVYKMVVDEVELSLLSFVMKHVRGNQCKASELLGINRGTLRKKLKQHHLIN